jgi:ketosteroid isomerase-like protein
MPTYSDAERRNIEAVDAMFGAGREFDRSTLFADDAVWWNGLPLLPGNVGETEHRGIGAIRRILGGSGQPHPGTGIDSYDLATNRFTDVVVLADGDYVVRQHTQHSTTLGGKPYRNVYCFVFRFNAEGKIQYLTEHWNTWYAHRVLFDNFPVEPAHPEAPKGDQ